MLLIAIKSDLSGPLSLSLILFILWQYGSASISHFWEKMLPNGSVSILYCLVLSSNHYYEFIKNLIMNFIRESKMLFNADVTR